jgi:hypothetical protein
MHSELPGEVAGPAEVRPGLAAVGDAVGGAAAALPPVVVFHDVSKW